MSVLSPAPHSQRLTEAPSSCLAIVSQCLPFLMLSVSIPDAIEQAKGQTQFCQTEIGCPATLMTVLDILLTLLMEH